MLLSRKLGRAIAAVLLLSSFGRYLQGQDPIRTLPKNYWIEYENAWVRVVHVHYAPKEVLPQHDHPKTPALYVYLADAGPVRFKHTGPNPYALDRPAVKRGGFRFNPGVIEEHTVENINDTATDFLRVEFKTIPFGRETLRGHFPPASADFWKPAASQAIAFEDENLRILRLGLQLGAKEAFGTAPCAIDIVIRGSSLRAGTVTKRLHSGEVWASPSNGTVLENSGPDAVELLQAEFKKGM